MRPVRQTPPATPDARQATQAVLHADLIKRTNALKEINQTIAEIQDESTILKQILSND